MLSLAARRTLRGCLRLLLLLRLPLRWRSAGKHVAAPKLDLPFIGLPSERAGERASQPVSQVRRQKDTTAERSQEQQALRRVAAAAAC